MKSKKQKKEEAVVRALSHFTEKRCTVITKTLFYFLIGFLEDRALVERMLADAGVTRQTTGDDYRAFWPENLVTKCCVGHALFVPSRFVLAKSAEFADGLWSSRFLAQGIPAKYLRPFPGSPWPNATEKEMYDYTDIQKWAIVDGNPVQHQLVTDIIVKGREIYLRSQ